MWLTTLIIVSFAVCFDSGLPVNAATVSASNSTSLLLSRASAVLECATDSECTASGSSCVDGSCECGVGYAYTADLTSCVLSVTAYGDACEHTSQCSSFLLTGGTCQDQVCVCAEGYHYTRGRCYRSSGLGEACSADVYCYINADPEATSCVDGVCVCSEGFYQREYRTCRRGGYAVGDECSINHDCLFENGICSSSFICAASTTARVLENDDLVEDDADEVSLVVRSLERVDEIAVVGSECDSDEDCGTLAHSKCGATGTCICDRAYYASTDSRTCLAEIGEECSEDDAVTITNSLCRDGTWSCGYSTVVSVNQKVCRRSTKSYTFSCLYDEQCYLFGPDSSCQNRRCLCDEGSHFVEELLYCWVSKGIGESCQVDEDCHVENLDDQLTCTNSVCTCPAGKTPNSLNTFCRTDDAQLGDVCAEDEDCSVQNAACVNSVCACPDNYFVLDDYCAAGLNAACSNDTDCVAANSVCTENDVCACAETFVIGDADTCISTAAYGEECQYDIQCSTTIRNSYCSETTTVSEDHNSTVTRSTCDCETDYHYRFGTCYEKAGIGEACTNVGNCYVEEGIDDVVCRKGICTCTWGAAADSSTGCTRGGTGGASTYFISVWTSFLIIGVRIFLM